MKFQRYKRRKRKPVKPRRDWAHMALLQSLGFSPSDAEYITRGVKRK